MTQYSGNNFWVEVDMEDVNKLFIKLAKLGTNAKDLQPILKKAAIPLKREAKLTAPKNEFRTVNTLHATVRRHWSGGKMRVKTQIHKPGNLQRSIDIFKSKVYYGFVYVGNMVGRSARYDGWYGRLITFGHRASGGKKIKRRSISKKKGEIRNKAIDSMNAGYTIVPPNDFMQRAFNRTYSQVINIMTEGLIELIEKYENK